MGTQLYTAKEMASILKVSPKTIYKAAERGDIESYRIGRSIRFVLPTESEETNNEKDTSREDC